MLREIATHNAAEDGFLCLRQRLRLRWRRPQRLRQCLGPAPAPAPAMPWMSAPQGKARARSAATLTLEANFLCNQTYTHMLLTLHTVRVAGAY